MIFFIIVVALGFLTKQNIRYWKFVASAIAFQVFADLFFSARGTLENPSADGYITAIVRHGTNDNENVLWVLPFAMIFGWVIPIYLIHKGYKRKEADIDKV